MRQRLLRYAKYEFSLLGLVAIFALTLHARSLWRLSEERANILT